MADMHDGDQKLISWDPENNNLLIQPHGNDQKWLVNTTEDADCTASIDFRVPGKPGPPPCALKGHIASIIAMGQRRRSAIGFTDPSGQLNEDPDFPLNYWIE